MEAGSSCVIYSCKKKIVDSNVKIQALKLVSTMKNIATLWTSRKDKKQEKTPKEPVDICWKTISCLLAVSKPANTVLIVTLLRNSSLLKL